MSDRINLYLNGELEAIVDHLSGTNLDRLDIVDAQALLINVCTRLDRVVNWSETEITRLERQIERLAERCE